MHNYMKRRLIISLLSLLSFTTSFSQIYKTKEYIEAVKATDREYNRQKAAEKAAEKDREQQERHEQQRIRHDAKFTQQMNKLNGISAGDYLNSPPIQETGQKSSIKSKSANSSVNKRTTVVASSSNENDNRKSNNPFANSGKIGTQSKSDNNYTGDRYSNKHSTLGTTRRQLQIRKTADEYRKQYPTAQPRNKKIEKQGVMRVHTPSTKPRVDNKVLQQAKNSQKQITQPFVNKQAATYQQETSERKVVQTSKSGKLIINDPQKVVMIQQEYSSSDLAPVDTRRIDYATEIKNINVYSLPNEAQNLYDNNNNKLPNKVPLAKDEITEETRTKMMKEDVANGFASFDNRRMWEYIYDYEYNRTIKIPSSTVKKTKNTSRNSDKDVAKSKNISGKSTNVVTKPKNAPSNSANVVTNNNKSSKNSYKKKQY